MNLSLLILLPLVTALAILFSKGLKQIRVIGLAGSIAQLGLAGWILKLYMNERSNSNTTAYLFESNYSWFKALHINYHIGIDGISLAMILLTSFIVVAGILVSWTMEQLSKEYFFGSFHFILSLRNRSDP
jgi:NADH-quinone oxidoreductase subunit M